MLLGAVVPGFVDGHTHPVWSGDRVHEFAMKLAGATYLDIHKVREIESMIATHANVEALST